MSPIVLDQVASIVQSVLIEWMRADALFNIVELEKTPSAKAGMIIVTMSIIRSDAAMMEFIRQRIEADLPDLSFQIASTVADFH